MARKITLFTRFLKGFSVAPNDVVPPDATSAVTLETGRSFGWTASPVRLDAPTVLESITADPAVATADEAYSGTTAGRTEGSTLSLYGAGAAGLSIDNASGAITGTPSAAGPVNVVETLAGAVGSPKTNAAVITVS